MSAGTPLALHSCTGSPADEQQHTPVAPPVLLCCLTPVQQQRAAKAGSLPSPRHRALFCTCSQCRSTTGRWLEQQQDVGISGHAQARATATPTTAAFGDHQGSECGSAARLPGCCAGALMASWSGAGSLKRC